MYLSFAQNTLPCEHFMLYAQNTLPCDHFMLLLYLVHINPYSISACRFISTAFHFITYSKFYKVGAAMCFLLT